MGYYFFMQEKKTLGGARPGAGRKPKVAGAPATQSVTVKLSDMQKEKLQRLGGAPWVRQKIDKAPEPKE
ncbi:hypothetical protein [Pseudorhodoferax soli]|uniref:hypothetical protein n=1 Tax=Pseudorhodoferax soli TaxID=545864 RepID=UPI0011C057B0|nr:hypothetical protein [Pseudorhodoferax soli]